MPRRRHTFIDRSKAKTYQLVHTSGGETDGEKHVLVPVNEAAAVPGLDPSTGNYVTDLLRYGTATGDEIDASQLDEAYETKEYELGEYGLPDDGYDYSQHFKTIGGGGGVFMDAITGMPNPDAVSGSSTKKNSTNVGNGKDGFLLKEDMEDEEKTFPAHSWKLKEDVYLTEQAIEEIKRDRKRNKDLDEVFTALDSEGELDSSSNLDDEGDGRVADNTTLDFGLDDGNDLLEDDFVASAQQADENASNLSAKLDGVVERFREPRLLDEQFDKFMRSQDLASSDDEEDSDNFFPAEDANRVEDVLDFQAHLTAQELDDLWGGDGGLLDDLSKLQINSEVGTEENAAAPNLESGVVEVNTGLDRATEYEDFARAEFERGMVGLLDSYNRVSAEEALGAFDGVDGAFDAIARHEREEQAKIDERLKHGFGEESDGHDSELDSKLDDMLQERDDTWDCETILSTYSNLENHPSVIDAPSGVKRRSVQKQPIIRLDPRTQAPEGYIPGTGASPSADTELMDFGSSRREVAQNTQARERGESKEQKKARKAAVKEAARERRALKSEMKKAFGSESVKQSRHATALGTSKVAMKF